MKHCMFRYNNNTYHIRDIDYDQNPLSTFQRDDNTEMSYFNYFQQVVICFNMRVPLIHICLNEAIYS